MALLSYKFGMTTLRLQAVDTVRHRAFSNLNRISVVVMPGKARRIVTVVKTRGGPTRKAPNKGSKSEHNKEDRSGDDDEDDGEGEEEGSTTMPEAGDGPNEGEKHDGDESLGGEGNDSNEGEKHNGDDCSGEGKDDGGPEKLPIRPPQPPPPGQKN